MKSQILSYLFYFMFWMSGVIYATIEKTDIAKNAKYIYEQSFEDDFNSSKKLHNVSFAIPTQHLPEITVIAKLPEKKDKSAEDNPVMLAKAEQLQDELSDESDLSNLIQLIEEIESESMNLSNLTKYLPIAEIDSKAYDQRLIPKIV